MLCTPNRISNLFVEQTSYPAAAGGAIVNQLKYEYDAFGRVTREYQSHSGAVT